MEAIPQLSLHWINQRSWKQFDSVRKELWFCSCGRNSSFNINSSYIRSNIDQALINSVWRFLLASWYDRTPEALHSTEAELLLCERGEQRGEAEVLEREEDVHAACPGVHPKQWLRQDEWMAQVQVHNFLAICFSNFGGGHFLDKMAFIRTASIFCLRGWNFIFTG